MMMTNSTSMLRPKSIIVDFSEKSPFQTLDIVRRSVFNDVVDESLCSAESVAGAAAPTIMTPPSTLNVFHYFFRLVAETRKIATVGPLASNENNNNNSRKWKSFKGNLYVKRKQ